MKCPNCGSEVGVGARFCSNCGSVLNETAKEGEPEAPTPYCRNCAAKVPAGAEYCTNCGEPVKSVKLTLASWGERFIAWLIDMIILGILLGPWITLPGFIWAPYFPRWIPFVDFGSKNVIYFLYWTLMEGVYEQSIGKMAMKIKVTQLDGKRTDVVHALIESLGKAFLLPVDCIIGWILYPTKRQRLFNYISETVIVKMSKGGE